MTAVADDDEMTELVDADFPRVDLVGKGANGIPRFLIAKQDQASAGLLDPEFVRDLIAKAEPEDSGRGRVTMPNGITLTGSAAEMAAFIHKAAAPAAPAADDWDYAAVCKEKYSAADRKKMSGSGAAMAGGSYPIADEEDLHRAIRAVGRGGASHNAIRKHIISRARSLGKSSLIPDNWNSDGSLKESVSKEDAVTGSVAKADIGPDLDEGVDGLDPTVPLAAPDEMGAGDVTDPGSPAWESVDAATAQKWCSILSRAKVAVGLLSDRELLEAASGDSDDAEKACDLQDACCAIDFAISVLAPFAVAEQSAADCGEDELMAAVGKAAASDPGPVLAAIRKAMDGGEETARALFTLESLGAVIRKSGRVLSAVNESHLREAHARLNAVLSSLPQAPKADDGQAVAKMTPAEEAPMPDAMPSETATAESGQSPAMGTREPPMAAREAVDVAKAADEAEVPAGEPQDAPVAKAADVTHVGLFDAGRRFLGLADPACVLTDIAKADGDGKKAMCVVYNQAGKLMGIVDPDDITPVANSEAEPDEAPGDGDGDGAPDAAAPDAGDMTPQPPADAGTPAEDVAKGTQPEAQDPDTRTVLKGIVTEALTEILGAQGAAEGVAKSADVAALSGRLEDVLARLETVEKQDARPGVFANGAVPPPGSVPPARPSLRGQDQDAAGQVDVAKAMERRREFLAADPADQNRIANEMQQGAIDALAAIHRR